MLWSPVERSRPLVARVSRPLVAAPLLVLIAIILFALGSVLVRRTAGDPFLDVNSSGGLGPLQSRAAPDFDIPRFDGGSLRMADLKGRAVVVNFWSSWCVPCQREMPVLARMAREYDPQSVAIVGIALWDARSDAEGFLGRYGGDLTSGFDERGKVAIDFGVGGLPETFFVRPDGTLSRRWIGELNEAQLRRFIDEMRA